MVDILDELMTLDDVIKEIKDRLGVEKSKRTVRELARKRKILIKSGRDFFILRKKIPMLFMGEKEWQKLLKEESTGITTLQSPAKDSEEAQALLTREKRSR